MLGWGGIPGPIQPGGGGEGWPGCGGIPGTTKPGGSGIGCWGEGIGMPGTTKPGGCGDGIPACGGMPGPMPSMRPPFSLTTIGQVGHPGRLQVFNGDCQMA